MIQTADKMQHFTIFQHKLHAFNIQNRTKHAWAFSKTVQKISKITFTASRFSLLTTAKFSVNIKKVTLQHNKEFTVFIFLFNGFIIIKKKDLYLSVNVFSTKVLIGDTIFTSPNGDGTAILRGHPSHAKVSPLAVQRKYLHFSVILRP